MSLNLNGGWSFRADLPTDLLAAQRPAVGLILKRFVEIARIVLRDKEQLFGDHLDSDPHITRPHHVLCIDGARGSGKTFVLLTVEHAIKALSDSWQKPRAALEGAAAKWNEFVSLYTPRSVREQTRPSRNLGVTQLADTLNIIFPGDMEIRESVMEAIFACMTDNLESFAKNESDPKNKKRAEELRNKLRDEVAQGWYFAKNFGHEAIVHDAVDYADFITRFEVETRKSARRVDTWRRFVSDYLDFIGSAMLVVLLDDSDIKPELTIDILHTIRMFLNQPRVITILAGNIRSMRNTLVHHAMRDLGGSMSALSDRNGQTANDWRRNERKAIEDYLEKVLPLSSRFFIKQMSIPGQLADGSQHDDFKQITKLTLTELCQGMLTRARHDFLTTKFHLAIAKAISLSDGPTGDRRRNLENYLTWWVFANRYLDSLAPRSARQIITFGDYYVHQLQDGEGEVRPQKRLIISLFENPANFPLIHQLQDGDINVGTWLQHQTVDSVWVGQRLFNINGRDLDQGRYGYDYIRFRLDLGLAMPVRQNSEDAIPQMLLPVPSGRRHMRRFFQPHGMPRRQRRVGISKWIDHAVIPGNCLYFYDLEALPDCSLLPGRTAELRDNTTEGERGRAPGVWEAGLAHNWMEVIEDDQDESVYRYFVEVVCASQREMASVASADLLGLLDPPSLVREQYDGVYERFLEDEFASFSLDRSNGPAGQWSDFAAIDRKDADSAMQAIEPKRRLARRRLALYSALISDIRRAWHAIRIYEHSSPSAATVWSAGRSEDERSSFTVIATQDHLRLYTHEQITRLFTATEWTKALFAVFSQSNLETTLKAVRPDLTICGKSWQSFLSLDLDSLQGIFGARSAARSRGVLGEEDDYKNWSNVLRSLGRVSCQGWPDYGDARDEIRTDHELESQLANFEEQLFFNAKQNADNRLMIVQAPAPPVGTDAPVAPVDPRSEARERKARSNGQDARSFAWLAYGLSPSLPGVIHCHVMALVYHAELTYHFIEVFSTEAKKEMTPVALRETLEGIENQYRAVLREIDRWAALVGQLSAVLRYIRVKYLHLHIGLLADSLDPLIRHRQPEELLQWKHWKEVLRKSSGAEISDAVASTTAEQIRNLFVGRDNIPARQLAIMPDVATSTLFGDSWLEDTLLSLTKIGKLPKLSDDIGETSTRQPIESTLQVTGVFAETEQWLWAANRCLRKMRELIQPEVEQRRASLHKLLAEMGADEDIGGAHDKA